MEKIKKISIVIVMMIYTLVGMGFLSNVRDYFTTKFHDDNIDIKEYIEDKMIMTSIITIIFWVFFYIFW